MTRALSSSSLKALYSQTSEEVFLVLLTFEHEDLESPIYITSETVETQSRGHTYLPFPFDLVLPDEVENRSPRARLTVENVSQEILKVVKALKTPAHITMEVIRAGDSDTVEAVFPAFKLTNVKYNALTLQGDLTIEDFTAEPYPATVFTPSAFPALF